MIQLLIGAIVTGVAGLSLWGISKLDDPSGDGTIALVFLTGFGWVLVVGTLIIGSILSVFLPVGGWVIAPVISIGALVWFFKTR